MKRILLGAFEKVYFKALRNRHVRYQNATLPEMIKHLCTNHIVITATDLEDNDTRIREQFDVGKPIKEIDLSW